MEAPGREDPQHALALGGYVTGSEPYWKLTDAGRAPISWPSCSPRPGPHLPRRPQGGRLGRGEGLPCAAENARIDGEPTVTPDEEQLLRRAREHTERAYHAAARGYTSTAVAA